LKKIDRPKSFNIFTCNVQMHCGKHGRSVHSKRFLSVRKKIATFNDFIFVSNETYVAESIDGNNVYLLRGSCIPPSKIVALVTVAKVGFILPVTGQVAFDCRTFIRQHRQIDIRLTASFPAPHHSVFLRAGCPS